MQTIYRPGSWYLLVRPDTIVALPPDAPAALIATLWEGVSVHGSLPGIIGALANGGSFLDLPAFVAAVVEGDDVRVAARGRVAIRVTSRSGADETVSGTNVSTWSERFVADAARIDLTVDEVEPGDALPIGSGIVLAAAASADLPRSAVRSAHDPGSTLDVEPVDASAIGPLRTDAAAGGVSDSPASAVPVPSGAMAPGETDVTDAVDEAGALDEADAVDEAPVEAVPQSVDPSADPDAAADALGEEEALPAGEESGADAVVDSVPGGEASGAAVDGSTLLPNEVTYAPAVDEFEHLWGETQHTPIEAAAVRPEPEPEPSDEPEVSSPPGAEPPSAAVPPAPPQSFTPAPPQSFTPAPPQAELGDHDGATISVAEARALRGAASADETPTAIIPQLGTAGRIRMSTGQTVALDRTVIIGRRPRSTRASGSSMPHLIAVESPQQDISRNHLEVRPEGDAVIVIDLNTTNGSMLHRAGTDPVRLHPSEQTLVLDGDLIDLGDGVTVTFEGLA